MKFRSKPVVVDLVAFHPRQAADLEQTYPGLALTRNVDGTWTIWNELHRTAIFLTDNDFINVTHQGDYFPVTPEAVAQNYEPVEPEP